MPDRSPIVPETGGDDAPFWAAAREHELRMQECLDCAHVRWLPGPVCPECWSTEYRWAELSGRGTVNSWVVVHLEYDRRFAEQIPYNVAEIELAEGPRYIANLVECDNDDIYRGMPVEVVFDDVTEEVTLPKFQPRDE